jgi:hypothetical protein
MDWHFETADARIKLARLYPQIQLERSTKSWRNPAMRTKNHRPALIEGLEQRVLFDASQLTETIINSTLPAAVSDQATLKGTVSLQLGNNSGVTQEFKGAIAVDVADKVLNIPGKNFVILRSMPAAISLKVGQIKVFKVAINIPGGKLADGNDTLFGVVTDQTNAFSQSPAGPALLVRPPNVSLSETETFKNLPASTGVNATLKAVDKIKITNTGSDPFTGLLNIALLAAPNDAVAGATSVTAVAKKFTIPANHSVAVSLNFRSEAGLSPVTYRMLSAVTQPNGTVTSSNPATAPSFTIIAPATKPNFVDTISSANGIYAPDQSDSSAQHITQLDLFMSIVNKGAVSIGSDQFTLFASTKPTFDSSAIKENSQPLQLTLDEYPGSNNPFQIDINVPDNGPDNGTPVNYYIFVQVTDTSGGVSMASYATPISFAGPIG